MIYDDLLRKMRNRCDNVIKIKEEFQGLFGTQCLVQAWMTPEPRADIEIGISLQFTSVHLYSIHQVLTIS